MNFGNLRTRNGIKLSKLQLYVLAPLLHSSNPLGLAAKKRFQGARAYYAVHPLENYSLHPIGSQSGYCYPTPEMPTQGARLRPAPGSQFFNPKVRYAPL